MPSSIKKIAINTGGGDAPGLNAVIHGAVYAARGLGWDIAGIREGYDGLLEPDRYPHDGLVELRRSTLKLVVAARILDIFLGDGSQRNAISVARG